MFNRLVGRLHEHKSVLHSHTHTHIYLCLWDRCIVLTYMVWGWSRGSFIVVPTGADVAGTYSILSLILSPFASTLSLPLSLSLSRCLFFCRPLPFFAWTRWRDAPLQTFLAPDHNASSHVIQPAISSLSMSLSLCLCLSISARSPSVLFPLTKADKGLSFLLACLCSVCLYCTKLGSLFHCIPSFSLQRRCLGAPGPLLWDKGPASAQWGRWWWWHGGGWKGSACWVREQGEEERA